jgi:putative protein-disulfide isomerase
MMKLKLALIIMLGSVVCQAQSSNTMPENNKNPLICDPEKGICEMPSVHAHDHQAYNPEQEKPVKIIYFTDPICSACWGIEPQLRKLKLEYGHVAEIEYRMGGLLPDWSYNSGGISKPSDVAHHWDEVSQHYDMPIDGNIWLEDPLNSSYPPSIAFKAAQMQDEHKAISFLRRIREMVFLEKKNITRWEFLSAAASETGLDTVKFKADYESGAIVLFQEDLSLAKKMGVRGFPTLFFRDSLQNQLLVYGFKPYQSFEGALLKIVAEAIKKPYDHAWSGLFSYYPTLTTREFSELSGLSKSESENLLQNLESQDQVAKRITKNGVLWVKK